MSFLSTVMSEPDSPLCPSTLAALSVRFFGFVLVVLGFWQAVLSLLEGWMEFDPTYLGYFLRNQFLRPVVTMVFGLLLLRFGKLFGRWLTRPL